MNVKGLDHINLSVGDFDETVAWYGRVFGFELVEDKVLDGVRWGVIRAADAMLCIYDHREFKFENKDDRLSRGVHGVSHFGLRVADREAWKETVEREGLHVLYGGPVRWPHSTAWYITDPTGYEIEVASWDEDKIAF